MAKKTGTQTTDVTTTRNRSKAPRAATKRITSLEPKRGTQLSSLEESVVRMHHGVSLKPTAALATNGINDHVMGQLVEIEVKSHLETGRIDDLPDLPTRATTSNAKTQKLVDKLKKKS